LAEEKEQNAKAQKTQEEGSVGWARSVVPNVGDIASLGAVERLWGAVRKKRAVGGDKGR
jgi:hypothetical protein